MEKRSLTELLKNSWRIFSKGYRRVFKYLWWFFRHLRTVFPSLDTISMEVKLSKRQVQNALNHFLGLGLLGWVKRPYQSNVYFMPEEIIEIDLKDEKSMNARSEQNCHQDCHVLPVASSSVFSFPCTSGTPSANVPKSSKKEEEKAAEERKTWFNSLHRSLRLKFMWESFDFKRFGWITKNLSECQIYEILNDFSWYRKQRPIQNPERFFTQRALAYLRGRK